MKLTKEQEQATLATFRLEYRKHYGYYPENEQSIAWLLYLSATERMQGEVDKLREVAKRVRHAPRCGRVFVDDVFVENVGHCTCDLDKLKHAAGLDQRDTPGDDRSE